MAYAKCTSRKIWLALFLFSITSPHIGWAVSGVIPGNELPEDPYRQITEETLSNGLHVVYAPDQEAKTFRFKAVMKAGFASEEERTSGISHLLEHYLFTDGKLDDDMSYLEVIREKGGEANGQTTEMHTAYWAMVPNTEVTWLTRLFYKMIFHRMFDPATLEQTKKPVLLEIGKPEPLAQLLDSPLMKVANPEYLKEPDFWKSEFGIYHEHFSHAHESLNTYRLRVEDLQSYYHDYYRPGNITIYLAGKFEIDAARELISSTFGTVSDWPGKGLVEQTPVPRPRPYVRSTAATNTPYIAIGTKVQDLSPEEELTVRVYLEHLSHRLMKEIRNKHGDTYTVRSSVSLRENFGDAYLMMEAPSERYQQYLQYAKSLIVSEAREGKFTEQQYNDAMKLYSSHFKLADHDSGTQLGLAEALRRWTRIYGKRVSEFDAFRDMRFDVFKAKLQKLFVPEQEVSSLYEPPVFGRLESWFLYVGIIALYLTFARRIFASRFEHAKVRWMRKLALPPAYLAEGSFLTGGVFLSSYAYRALNLVMLRSNFIQSHYVLSEYFGGAASLVLALTACLFCCSFLTRKAIVSGDSLYLKSMTYRSKKIAMGEIESVESMSLMRVLKSGKTLWSIKWRFQFMDLCFWRSGTLIRRTNGKSYYLGIRRSDLAASELTALLPKLKFGYDEKTRQAA